MKYKPFIKAGSTHDINSVYDFIQAQKTATLNGRSYADTITQLRKLGKSNTEYTKRKNSLQLFYTMAEFKNGDNATRENVESCSGYFFFDVDDVSSKPEEMKQAIIASEISKNVLAMWTSAGGKGLGGLIKHNAKDISFDNHNAVFEDFYSIFKDIGLKLDQKCSNLNRGTCLTYDENIYINNNAEEFEFDLAELRARVTKKSIINTKKAAVIEGKNLSEQMTVVINAIKKYDNNKLIGFHKKLAFETPIDFKPNEPIKIQVVNDYVKIYTDSTHKIPVTHRRAAMYKICNGLRYLNPEPEKLELIIMFLWDWNLKKFFEPKPLKEFAIEICGMLDKETVGITQALCKKRVVHYSYLEKQVMTVVQKMAFSNKVKAIINRYQMIKELEFFADNDFKINQAAYIKDKGISKPTFGKWKKFTTREINEELNDELMYHNSRPVNLDEIIEVKISPDELMKFVKTKKSKQQKSNAVEDQIIVLSALEDIMSNYSRSMIARIKISECIKLVKTNQYQKGLLVEMLPEVATNKHIKELLKAV